MQYHPPQSTANTTEPPPQTAKPARRNRSGVAADDWGRVCFQALGMDKRQVFENKTSSTSNELREEEALKNMTASD